MTPPTPAGQEISSLFFPPICRKTPHWASSSIEYNASSFTSFCIDGPSRFLALCHCSCMESSHPALVVEIRVHNHCGLSHLKSMMKCHVSWLDVMISWAWYQGRTKGNNDKEHPNAQMVISCCCCCLQILIRASKWSLCGMVPLCGLMSSL